ncbi:hypothetical protein FS827_10460 [Agrobacterium vitis]|uniref:hypothetical protein n=1 Tax=Allorhizobium ampelinum TaxID=3025782 RepID=UPI001F24C132|nr:hypothetical protein [Allorhizobium ampelinum]MCF1461747.1 hypothetical protein [Allorhizobium ampelinum]
MDTADEILAIPVNEPERLFQAPDQITGQYHRLAKLWHPDHAGGQRDVFEHLTLLRDEANLHVSQGRWQVPGLLELAGRKIRYFKSYPFELGTAYVGNSIIAYVVEKDFLSLAHRAEAAIRGLTFANDRMATEMLLRLPQIKSAFDTDQGQRVLVMEKPAGLVRLSDLISHFGSKVDPRHVAWVMSDLLNTACYLGSFRQLAHAGLCTDTVFISPKGHVAVILGGWFYSTPLNEPLVVLPEWTDQLLPAAARNTERASGAIDLELIRGIGREMLGETSGASIGEDNAIPQAMRDWLQRPSGLDAKDEYRAWIKALEDSFGARRFTELSVNASDVYGKDAHNG